MIKASANDSDPWKEELEDIVSDFREIRRFMDAALGGKDRPRSPGRRCWSQKPHQQFQETCLPPRVRSKEENSKRERDVRVGRAFKNRLIAAIELYEHSPTGCEAECATRRAHVCELCLEPHRSSEFPQHPAWRPPVKGAKGAGKGKHKGKK